MRDLQDARQIADRGAEIEEAVVIGAGLVGLDAAIGLNQLGVDVSIVELGDQILPQQLDQEASARYQSRFAEAGIEIMTNQSAQKLISDNQNHVQGLKLDNGEEIKAQMVIVAAGVKSNTNLVENTALDVEQGIVVDQYQQTTVDNIYAAGDVSQSKEVFSEELILTPI